ncbi:MAG: coproporphyrinogen III oxidase family protein, partial [Deltaproteobacteria bacterium]|nr:coproporphyrinogen III oxidase family protein [Deltaproteobacteria bacterium]
MPPPVPPGLYAHVPFCPRRCPYCDFYSIAGPGPGQAGLYLAGLGRELDLALRPGPAPRAAPARDGVPCRESGPAGGPWDGPFGSLYLGGGSPSALPPEAVRGVFSVLGRLPLSEGAEVTLEANPQDVTRAKCALWRELGVTRLS